MAHVAVCVTAPSHAEAKAIGRALTEARLAASVNIVVRLLVGRRSA